MGFFGIAHGSGEQKDPLTLNLPHISYITETWDTYILPKEDPRNMKISWHIFLSSADISDFSPEISHFVYIKKYKCRLHFNK